MGGCGWKLKKGDSLRGKSTGTAFILCRGVAIYLLAYFLVER